MLGFRLLLPVVILLFAAQAAIAGFYCVSICSHEFCCSPSNDGICPTDYISTDDRCEPCDPDCEDCDIDTNSAKLSGTVRTQTEGLLKPIEDADVMLVRPGYRYLTSTDALGNYQIDRISASRIGTQYKAIASAVGYETEVVDLAITTSSPNHLDFILKPTASDCRQDCTRKYNVCDKTCHGLNGCWFHVPLFPGDVDGMALCDPGDGLLDGHTTDHIIEATESLFLQCCESPPIQKDRVIKPDIYVDSDNVLVTRRIVLLNGNTVTMNVIVYD